MKIFKKSLIGLVVLLVVLFFGRNFIAKMGIEIGAKVATGLGVSVGKVDIGANLGSIHLVDLKVKNPSGFEDKIMLDIPEVFLSVDVKGFLANKINISEIRMNLKEFFIVTNSEGELNLDKLKEKTKSKGDKKEGSKKGKQKKDSGKNPKITIGTVDIKIGRVVEKNYSQGGAPVVKEYNLNIDERIEDLDNSAALVPIIMAKILAKTTIASLANFDLQGLRGSAKGILKLGGKTIGGTADKAGDVVGSTANKLKGVTKGLSGIFKKSK